MDASERIGPMPEETTVTGSPRALRRVAAAPPPGAPNVPPDLRIAELVGVFRRHIANRPLTSTLIAAGAGFVLGGALSFRAGRMALAVLGRHVVREVLKEVL